MKVLDQSKTQTIGTAVLAKKETRWERVRHHEKMHSPVSKGKEAALTTAARDLAERRTLQVSHPYWR